MLISSSKANQVCLLMGADPPGRGARLSSVPSMHFTRPNQAVWPGTIVAARSSNTLGGGCGQSNETAVPPSVHRARVDREIVVSHFGLMGAALVSPRRNTPVCTVTYPAHLADAAEWGFANATSTAARPAQGAATGKSPRKRPAPFDEPGFGGG